MPDPISSETPSTTSDSDISTELLLKALNKPTEPAKPQETLEESTPTIEQDGNANKERDDLLEDLTARVNLIDADFPTLPDIAKIKEVIEEFNSSNSPLTQEEVEKLLDNLAGDLGDKYRTQQEKMDQSGNNLTQTILDSSYENGLKQLDQVAKDIFHIDNFDASEASKQSHGEGEKETFVSAPTEESIDEPEEQEQTEPLSTTQAPEPAISEEPETSPNREANAWNKAAKEQDQTLLEPTPESENKVVESIYQITETIAKIPPGTNTEEVLRIFNEKSKEFPLDDVHLEMALDRVAQTMAREYYAELISFYHLIEKYFKNDEDNPLTFSETQNLQKYAVTEIKINDKGVLDRTATNITQEDLERITQKKIEEAGKLLEEQLNNIKEIAKKKNLKQDLQSISSAEAKKSYLDLDSPQVRSSLLRDFARQVGSSYSLVRFLEKENLDDFYIPPPRAKNVEFTNIDVSQTPDTPPPNNPTTQWRPIVVTQPETAPTPTPISITAAEAIANLSRPPQQQRAPEAPEPQQTRPEQGPSELAEKARLAPDPQKTDDFLRLAKQG